MKTSNGGATDRTPGRRRAGTFEATAAVKLWYSIDLCEDARPFAPHMSCGSRATRPNLKRMHPVPSIDLHPHVGVRKLQACLRAHTFLFLRKSFLGAGTVPRTVARSGAHNHSRWSIDDIGD